MPWSDWQFWVVTVLMLIAVWLVFRSVVPKRRSRGVKTELTVGGKSRGTKALRHEGTKGR